jgi:hypothetical protein
MKVDDLAQAVQPVVVEDRPSPKRSVIREKE